MEFGAFSVTDTALGIPAGEYLALLSHSGSRGTGAKVCEHYSKRAMARHDYLPKELKHLAWLSLDDEDGQEYWGAMNLMGEYAAANHALIHRAIGRKLGANLILDVENHHNFAWKETHGGREVIVHRKGATPAGKGVLGVIPGSMASPGYVVRGRGEGAALHSASHGAGRVMSRTKALQSFTWSGVKKLLAKRGVELLSSGLDEVPGRLQGHRDRDGRAAGPRGRAGTVRSENRQDVPGGRPTGGLIGKQKAGRGGGKKRSFTDKGIPKLELGNEGGGVRGREGTDALAPSAPAFKSQKERRQEPDEPVPAS